MATPEQILAYGLEPLTRAVDAYGQNKVDLARVQYAQAVQERQRRQAVLEGNAQETSRQAYADRRDEANRSAQAIMEGVRQQGYDDRQRAALKEADERDTRRQAQEIFLKTRIARNASESDTDYIQRAAVQWEDRQRSAEGENADRAFQFHQQAAEGLQKAQDDYAEVENRLRRERAQQALPQAAAWVTGNKLPIASPELNAAFTSLRAKFPGQPIDGLLEYLARNPKLTKEALEVRDGYLGKIQDYLDAGEQHAPLTREPALVSSMQRIRAAQGMFDTAAKSALLPLGFQRKMEREGSKALSGSPRGRQDAAATLYPPQPRDGEGCCAKDGLPQRPAARRCPRDGARPDNALDRHDTDCGKGKAWRTTALRGRYGGCDGWKRLGRWDIPWERLATVDERKARARLHHPRQP